MRYWACPNADCVFDKKLEPRQCCPFCGVEAKEFAFSELGQLWKQKWSQKKSLETARKEERLLGTAKFCPKCGSGDVDIPVFYRPSIWRCRECGYEGSFILQDGTIVEIVRKIHLQKKPR